MRVRTTTSGWSGSNGLSTFYFASPGAMDTSSEALADEAVNRVQAFWVALRPLFPSIWSFETSNDVDALDAPTGHFLDALTADGGGGDIGTGGTEFGPVAAGFCVNHLTNGVANFHRVRGRTFLSPVAQGGDANGTPQDSSVVAVRAAAALLITEVNDPLVQVVWHRPVNEAGGSIHEVTGHTVRDSFSMLTSRR